MCIYVYIHIYIAADAHPPLPRRVATLPCRHTTRWSTTRLSKAKLPLPFVESQLASPFDQKSTCLTLLSKVNLPRPFIKGKLTSPFHQKSTCRGRAPHRTRDALPHCPAATGLLSRLLHTHKYIYISYIDTHTYIYIYIHTYIYIRV